MSFGWAALAAAAGSLNQPYIPDTRTPEQRRHDELAEQSASQHREVLRELERVKNHIPSGPW